MHYIFLTRLRRAFTAVAILACSTGAYAYSSLLAPISLAGDSYNVTWTNLSSTNPGLAFNSGASTGTASLAATGAFSATLGLYSLTGNYSFTIDTTTAFSPEHVVLQYVGGSNPDFDYLTFNGGPVLTYTLGDGSGQATITASAVLAGPLIYPDSPVGPVSFYTWAWEWDLSSVTGTITGISISTSVPIHTSTTGIRLDVGSSFVGSAIPEPSAFAAFAGFGALIVSLFRRRARA